ncbi:enoyl-CoA hydratase/isomerase family protein [Sulfobacillus thermosulfidooxidans]|uniref:Short-chain dehydrogenase n=1 Tax=Sulfobacillus thermosulfidooxidans TaxID=28034 RepID=A0A1R0IK11_SULTH|nr:enoyl-CoA hydratase-related protein [Sulfobacillus thermosulfidooxidans]OLZ11120.1 short-chain dehydrogenase [Sulfobacillus thermosulfidooxidans]OLZ14103.1 short-chain dehydrogenase [Sulfobacillus thermosulfidooxidans]OLZ18847.1 short-chain dehydrogenase [Sulfobacillus thermosulfidooxidans]PSR26688.1 MAG: short-chain dehydrogenase [Sulfobacillus thermosulfidooxidans]
MALVSQEQRDHVMLFELNHPPVNSLSFPLLQELSEALDMALANDDIRAMVITGHGSFFAAGADIPSFLQLGSDVNEFLRYGVKLFDRIEQSAKPIIAAINGPALGGGNEMAMACDLRIACPDARFGQPEVNLGIIPGWGGSVRLPKLIGRSQATRLLLTGDAIDADEALRIGLIHHIVPSHLLVEYALNQADRLASLPPLALQAIKELLANPELGQAGESEKMAQLMRTDDATEGITAFLQKRRPQFRGR